MNDRPANTGPSEQQRRRILRTTVLLVLVAVGIYVAFIASGIMKAQP